MEDYIEIIKELILRYYSIEAQLGETVYKSTYEILTMLQGVIPDNPISEHDVFAVMKELGFQIKLIDNEFLWEMHEK